MIEVEADFSGSVEVAASPDEAYALVAEVPRSAAHFPGLEALDPREGGVYVWRLAKVGAGKLSLQTVYANRYAHDPEARRISWAPADGVDANTRVRGSWTVAPTGAGARLTFQNHATLSLRIPRLLRKPAEALIERENAKHIEQYLANLKRTLDGGDGRVRR